MTRRPHRIARTALSMLAAALLVPAIAVVPAAAQELGTFEPLCMKAAGDELKRQAQAEGKSVQLSDPTVSGICTKFLTTELAGPEPTCPPELGAYVKQLGLRQSATQATCLEMWLGLTRGGL